MSPLLYYLLQVVIASGILYLYYHIALRNKKFHQYNRFYLLGAIVISILVPFLNIPVYFTPQETQSSIVLETLTVISSPVAEPVVIEGPIVVESVAPTSTFNPYDLIYYAYILIASLALLRIAYSLIRISRLKRNNEVEKIDTIFFVNTNEPGTPFSFFRWMFWNRDIELRSEKGEQIFRHELFHIQQKHSIDLLFMELLTVIFWINPFFHLMKKELRAIHEFLADQFAVNRSNKWDYAELLLMQALQTKHTLVNPFFHNQIKRRIAMITNPEKTSYRYLRKLLVLPIAVLIVTVFAFKYKKAIEEDTIKAKETVTIVVDASHGGIDPGTKSPDGKYTEAQISLAIAKKIQQLAPEYNINVVMTRENDALPRGAVNAEDANRKRVEIARGADADALVAIHVNSASSVKEFQQGRSGIEGYMSYIADYPATRNLGSAILQELSTVHKTMKELRKRENQSIFVLDHSPCPAVILECGYINNATDLAFITDEANQEKIARSILAGVVKHRETFSGDIGHVILETDGPLVMAEDSSFVLRKAMIAFPKDKVLIECDTVITHETGTYSNGPSKAWNEMLIIIDGKKTAPSYLMEKTIRAKEIHWYTAKHPDAIKLYGQDAAPGLIRMTGVTIVSELPPSQYYKKTFDMLEGKRNKREVQDTDNKVFEKVEIEASLPGGEKAWRKFLQQNLDANIPFKNGAKPGTYTVFVRFMVDKNGKASDFKALTSHGYGMEEETMRVLKKVEKWNPGIQNGRVVNSIRKQPVTFHITGPEKSVSSAIIENPNAAAMVSTINSRLKVNKTLDRVVIGAVHMDQKNTGYVIDDTKKPLEVGSAQWTRYLQTQIRGSVAVEEGMKIGSYELFVHFALDKDGNIIDLMIRNHAETKFAEECRKVVRSLQKVLIPADVAKGETTFYIQPIGLSISPSLTLSQFKKITPHELLVLEKNIEIKTFTFTIDTPDGDIIQIVNTGNSFNEAMQKAINGAVAGNLITVESIKILFGGKETSIASKLYFIVSD